MAPARATPTSIAGMETPLTGMRARAVGETDSSVLRLSSRSNSDARSGSSLARIGQELDGLASDFDDANASNQRQMGDLADNMTAVHSFRADTVTTLAAAGAELLAAVRAAKEAASPVQSRDEHMMLMESADREKSEVIASIIDGQQELSRLRDATRNIDDRLSETIEKERLIRQYVSKSIPVLQSKVKLYALSSMTKLYEKRNRGNSQSCPVADDDIIAGFVADREGHDVRPFEFNLSEVSSFDAVNALWALV